MAKKNESLPKTKSVATTAAKSPSTAKTADTKKSTATTKKVSPAASKSTKSVSKSDPKAGLLSKASSPSKASSLKSSTQSKVGAKSSAAPVRKSPVSKTSTVADKPSSAALSKPAKGTGISLANSRTGAKVSSTSPLPVKPALKAEKKTKQKKEKKPKKPKGRIRIVPLLIVGALIAALIIFVNLFLNTIIKNGIQTAMENAFEARCDISYVDVSFTGASFEVRNLAQADKSKPMQNLFEFSKVSLNFDLTQLLLGRFVVDEVSVDGFKIGTARSISGEIPRIMRESEPKSDTQEGKFATAIGSTKSTVNENAKNVIEQAIETYNPENMMSSYLEKLQVPTLIDSSEKAVEEITAYWVDAVPELEKSGEDLFDSVEEIRTLLETDTVDVRAVTSGIDSIQKLVSQGQELQAQIDEVSNRLESDSTTIETTTSAIQQAIEADLQLIENEIEQIASFSFSDAQGLVGSTIEGFFIGILGDYYPLVQKGLSVLSNVKADAQESKREEEKKALARMHGRTVYFNAEMPSFLVRNVTFSGSDSDGWLSVEGFAQDISNNPDLLGRPAVSNFALSLAEFSGELDMVVDLRTEIESYPVEAVFNGSGFDTSFLNNSSTIGIPSVGGDASVTAGAKFTLDGEFDTVANFNFSPALLSTVEFEPSSVYEIYTEILTSIQEFYVQSTIAYSLEEGIDIGLDTDVDKQITDGLASALNGEIDALKESLKSEAQSYLDDQTDGFMSSVLDFGNYRDSVLDLQNGLDGFDSEMDSLKKELEDRLKSQAADAIQNSAGGGASDLINNFF